MAKNDPWAEFADAAPVAPATPGGATIGAPIFSNPKSPPAQTGTQAAIDAARLEEMRNPKAAPPSVTFRILAPEEAAQRGLPGDKRWQIGSDGKVSQIEGVAGSGGKAKGFDFLEQQIQGVEDLYKQDFKGFRWGELPGQIPGLSRVVPNSWRGDTNRFNSASGVLMGSIKEALGITGGEANSLAEVEVRFGPYIPKADDDDPTIEYKIKMLRDLLAAERAKIGVTAAQPSGGDPNAALGALPSAGQAINPAPIDTSSQRGTDPMMQGDIGFNQSTADLPAGAVEFQGALETAIRNGELKSAEDIIAYGKQRNFNIDPAQAKAAAEAIAKGVMPSVVTPRYEVDISSMRGTTGDDGIDAFGRAASNTVLANIPNNISAAVNTVLGEGPFSANLARENAISESDWKNEPVETLAGTLVGALMLPSGVQGTAKAAATAALRSGATREAAVVAARRAAAGRLGGEGGAYGVVQGAAGEGDLGDRAVGALTGGAVGSVTGAVMPYVAKGAAAAASATRSASGSATQVADRILTKAIRADGNRAPDLMRQAASSERQGIPYMLGDSGENARGLLSASARAPGEGRSTAINALDERQNGLSDRVVARIEADLGPVANPHQIVESGMATARTNAAPIYERAYARTGADAFRARVGRLIERPSMQRAFANARRIALEEGRNPEELGFAFDANGNVILHGAPTDALAARDAARASLQEAQSAYRQARTSGGNIDKARAAIETARTRLRDAEAGLASAPVEGTAQTARTPSWQTFDYIKRGMDDVVESYRDKTSGRLVLDTEGRAINNTLRSFLRSFDTVNPDYAEARRAWGGPVSGISAMNEGLAALKMTADDLEARLRDMSPFEREMFALGTRRAMAELVESKGDTANVVTALVGTGKKRAMLARLFGNRQGFQNFTDALATEQNAFQTFRRARTGSPTAPNLADDQELAVAAGVTDLATSGVPIISALRLAAKAKAGQSQEAAEAEVARLLGSTDPRQVREAIRRFKRAEVRLKVARAAINRNANAQGRLGSTRKTTFGNPGAASSKSAVSGTNNSGD